MLEWLWSLLPDKCEMPFCKRKGVRGNENVVDGMVMCDYCHMDYLRTKHGIWADHLQKHKVLW